MIGVYDFCGHYEWTFDWIERQGGHDALRAYWDEAISCDSQLHASELFAREGIPGMVKYYAHTLAEESPDTGYTITHTPEVFRIDMHDCPSKGFLIRNDLENYHDYCDHCMGWIGPTMKRTGFTIDHEHNHRGQCWWEFRPAGTPGGHSAPGAVSGPAEIRLLPGWAPPGVKIDHYTKANDPDQKG